MQPTGRTKWVRCDIEGTFLPFAKDMFGNSYKLQAEYREEAPAWTDKIYGRSVLVWRDVPVEVES